MLHRLLQIINTRGVHSSKELAQQLDVSEALLMSMINELVRMGYLKPLRRKCEGNCLRCSIGGACAVGGLGHVWVLTETGKKIAQAVAN